MKRVDDLNKVLSEYEIVVVEFSGENCPGCKSMKRVLEEIENDFKDMFFCEVNVDENPSAAGQFFVMSVPSVFIIADGMVVDQFIGAVGKEKVVDKLLAIEGMYR